MLGNLSKGYNTLVTTLRHDVGQKLLIVLDIHLMMSIIILTVDSQQSQPKSIVLQYPNLLHTMGKYIYPWYVEDLDNVMPLALYLPILLETIKISTLLSERV